jgi:hypothetical protein
MSTFSRGYINLSHPKKLVAAATLNQLPQPDLWLPGLRGSLLHNLCEKHHDLDVKIIGLD